MELELIRTYDPNGTNGEIIYRVCNTIELPWLQNQRNISCITEGRYELVSRFSSKHQHHLALKNVPDRSGILIHPANDALKELLGCIAPVTVHTAPGKGNQSRLAGEKLRLFVAEALERGKRVFL